MTSWAKNQIAKQLARFVKNLDPSQISLKFLKGEGELLNIELNEQVLTDLLELPPWLQLKKAICNRICAKIHWTSLKTDPIRLFLDCVEVEIYASENVAVRPKQVPPQQTRHTSKEKQHVSKTSKYGFAEKVVDGMYVSINSVVVAFKAPGFKASFSMSRFTVQSTDQCWVVPNNLRKTRIKDEQRGQVLIFKEIKWATMRLDADAAYVEASEQGSIPIRLITNNSAIHLTIKKRLNDCSLVSSRLEIILDDILWILTQSQLLKLSSFVHYLLRLRQRFLPLATHNESTKDHKPASGGQSAHNTSRSSQFQGQGHGSTLCKLFTEYDVTETSYHVKTNQIDLHLCDDQTLSGKSYSNVKQTKHKSNPSDQSGALLISIHKLRLDHYPYHIAGLKRKLERSDDDALFSRRQWAQQLFDFFLKNEGKRINQIAHILSKASGNHRRPVMYESFFLISCSKFAIMQVSTNDRQEPHAFLSSDKESLFLPEDMDSFLLDFTSYYFIGYRSLPVPPSNMFLKLNPVKLIFHPLTCIWLNKFIQSVIAGFEWTKEFMAKETGPPEHLDIRIECLMPQVSIPCESDSSLPHQEERPKALQIQISQAIISNSRIGTATSQSDLLMDVQNSLASKVYLKNNEFPNTAKDYGPLPNDYWVNDYSIIHSRFLASCHKNGACSSEENQTENENNGDMPKMSHVIHSRDDPVPRVIWCLWCEQLWIDFVGIKKSFGRPATLIDAVPIRLWLSFPVLIDKTLAANSATGLANGYAEQASCINGSVLNSEGVTTHGESISRPLIKTDSTTSLPASLHSSTAISSLSNASSSSSISTGSTVSSPPNDNCGSTHRLPVSQRDRRPSAEFSQSPLRTSYSETDLIPHASHDIKSNESSLQNGPARQAPVIGDAGPPPPYFVSQSHDSKIAQNPVGSIELLPPMYSQLPSYQCAVEAESDAEAPPLPSKVQKEVVDFLVGNEDKGKAENDSKNGQKLPTIGSILQVMKQTSVQLDHFQLVFLLRLQEIFSDVASKISEDTVHFQLSQSPIHREIPDATCFSLHLSVPSVSINIVLPPMEQVHSEQYLLLEERISSGKLTRFVQLLQPNIEIREPSSESGTCESKETVTSEEPQSGLSDDDFGTALQSEASCSTGDNIEFEKQNKERIEADLKQRNDEGNVKAESAHEAKRSSQDSTDDNNVAKFDVPSNPADHVMITDDSEGERDSEENEDFDKGPMFLDVCEAESKLRGALRIIDTSEVGTQTEISEITEDSGYETYRDEEVSVVCLKCKDVRLAIQTENENLLLKVIVEKLKLKEKGNITYGMTLDHRLSADVKKEKDGPIVSESRPQVMVRLLAGPAAKEFGDDAVQLGFAHVKVRDLDTKLHLGNAESLSEFVEDEYLVKKMPFKVELDHLKLKLMDNKPRRYLSALLPPPLEINILKLLVTGTADGKIALGRSQFMNLDNIEEQGENYELQKVELYESELLHNDEKGNARKRTDEEVFMENDRLVDDLKLANARLVSLEQERDAILKVVDKLQQELMWSNHENEKLLQKVNDYKIYLKNLNR